MKCCVHVFNMDRYMHANEFRSITRHIVDKEMNKETNEHILTTQSTWPFVNRIFYMQMYVVYINCTDFVYFKMLEICLSFVLARCDVLSRCFCSSLAFENHHPSGLRLFYEFLQLHGLFFPVGRMLHGPICC